MDFKCDTDITFPDFTPLNKDIKQWFADQFPVKLVMDLA